MSDSLQPHGLYSPWILQARILEWVAVPFSRGSCQPRDWTQVSHIVGGFFTCWATSEALYCWTRSYLDTRDISFLSISLAVGTVPGSYQGLINWSYVQSSLPSISHRSLLIFISATTVLSQVSVAHLDPKTTFITTVFSPCQCQLILHTITTNIIFWIHRSDRFTEYLKIICVTWLYLRIKSKKAKLIETKSRMVTGR